METLGAEAVDVFYVTDSTGGLLTDPDARRRVVAAVLSALSSDLSIQNVRGLDSCGLESAGRSTPWAR